MENLLGLLKIRVKRGINLAIRDIHKRSSDPYVIITMGKQKLKTCVVKENCNPEWNDELTLCVTDPTHSINLRVYDRDTFSTDDKMGDADIEIKAYLECCVKMLHYESSSNDDIVLWRVKPSRENCLAQESCIVWKNGKIVQDMFLRLRNVECGEVEVQLEFIILHGSDDDILLIGDHQEKDRVNGSPDQATNALDINVHVESNDQVIAAEHLLRRIMGYSG